MGVRAFQEAMASVAGTVERCTGEVQVAYSQVPLRPVCGSAYSVRPTAVAISRPGRAPPTAVVPWWVPASQWP